MHSKQTSIFQRTVAATLVAVFMAGCATTTTPYKAPVTDFPTAWKYASGSTVSSPSNPAGAWWKNFNDPQLDALIDEALLRNNDLAAATIRVRVAQLRTGIAADLMTPRLSGSISGSANKSLDGGPTSKGTSASIGASYEVDLWNRLGSQRDVAKWEELATEQDRQVTAIALVGTVASLYWQTGYLSQRIASGDQSIAYAQQTLDLVNAQYKSGAVSGLEVAQARQTVVSQQASQTQLIQQRVEAMNALAILFDGPPGKSIAMPSALPEGNLPALPEGIPADVLGRRPDLRAAELRLRESVSTIDATRASYYPALTLTGSLGSSSTALLNILANPVAALGVGLSLPFLQKTQMDLNIKVSQEQYAIAVTTFRQTLYQSLADVENFLSARAQYAAQADLLTQSLAAARDAERLFEVRYRAGAEPLKSWLDAQEKRRAAETALAQTKYDRLTNAVSLYQALGGDAGATSVR